MAKRRAMPDGPYIEAPEPGFASGEAADPAGFGLPLDADPPEGRREPVRLDVVIDRLLTRLGVVRPPWLDELAEAWPRILPAEVARATRPGKWDRHILYVYVPNSMRLFEIRRQHLPAIEQAVRRFAGDARVRAVRLTIDPG